jgi:hypothetical protein
MNSLALGQSLSILLQIEDDNELIGVTCPATGLLVWPLIRVPVLRTIMSDWLFKSAPLSSLGSNVNFINLTKNAAISSIHNFGYKANPQRNILIQSTGLGNYYRDGLIHDRLVGYFTQALPDQIVVYQDKPKNSFQDKYSFNPILHKSPRNFINKLYSKLAIKNIHRNLARRVVERAAENASVKFGYEFASDRVQSLSNLLASNLAVLPYSSETYANWFSKQGFRLLLKEDACYGGTAISIIHAARLCGMVVAEYQHGAISKGHDGYNVAEALATSHSFKAVLPDYLLTYGNWWSNQTNMPVQKIAIGNPHLTETLRSLRPVSHMRSQVLILGDGIETKMYLDLARKIVKLVKEQAMAVVFRPHPFERDQVKSSILPDGVRLDSHADIYSSLKESSVVISELSTGLFEAVGLVDKVLLWETDKSRFAFPEIPFKSFSTMDELESILNDKDSFHKDSHTVPATELWEPNWKQNYLRFVKGSTSR